MRSGANTKLYKLIYEHSFYKNKDGNLKVFLDKVVIAKNLAFLYIAHYYGGLWLGFNCVVSYYFYYYRLLS